MNRGNQILIALLALQALLALLFFWPRQPGTPSGEPLLGGLESEQVSRITITDEAGGRLELLNSEAGWVLAGTDDYPVTEGAAPDLLGKILALKSGRAVAEQEDSYARLKVADDQYASRVDLLLQDDTLRTLYVGTSPSYGASHVRLEGQREVYLASDLSSTDVRTQVSAWIDTAYFALEEQDIVSVTLENDSGSLEFVRQGGEWTLADLAEDETASSSAISSLVSRVASVRMLRPLGVEPKPSYGLQDPSAVLIIQTQSAEGTASTFTLQVGARSEQDGSYVVKSSESPYFVRVAEYTAQDWVEKTRDDLLETPEAE
jgi:hypothetical protein